MPANNHPRSRENLEILPEPQQLFALSAIAIEVAKKQSRLRDGHRYDNAKFLRVHPIETKHGEDEAGAIIGFEHKLVGHIRRIAPTREQPWRSWSLRLGWSMWATHWVEDGIRGTAARYSFEWNDMATTKALRQAHTLPRQDKLSLEDTIDRFGLTDESAAMLDADVEMWNVSQADCVLLQQDIADFCHRSDLIAAAVKAFDNGHKGCITGI